MTSITVPIELLVIYIGDSLCACECVGLQEIGITGWLSINLETFVYGFSLEFQ